VKRDGYTADDLNKFPQMVMFAASRRYPQIDFPTARSQPLVPHAISRALRSAEEAGQLLAVGISLQVNSVARAVPSAKASGARIVIVNAEPPTPFDHLAEADHSGTDWRRVARTVRWAGQAA
jgi:NAD-dependent SIR2 family protein deacetylase